MITTRSATGAGFVLVVITIAALMAFAVGITGALDRRGIEDPGSEVAQITDRLEATGYRETALVVLIRGGDPASPTGDLESAPVVSRIADDPAVESIRSLANRMQLDYVSTDGADQFMAISLKPTDDRHRRAAAERIAAKLERLPRVLVGGPVITESQARDEVLSDLLVLLPIGLLLSFLLSLLALRRPAVAALPPLIGAVAVVAGLALLRVVAELTAVSVFVLNLTAGLALALASGWTLLRIARRSAAPLLAGALALAVLFGILVASSQPFVRSIGIGGLAAVASAAAAVILVLPALLRLLGPRIDATTTGIMGRHAGPIAFAVGGAMLLACAPFYDVQLATFDPHRLPSDSDARQVDDALRADFTPFRDTPITIVLTGANEAQATAFAARVVRLPAIDRLIPAESIDDVGEAIQAFAVTPPTSRTTRHTIDAIRAIPTPAGVHVEVTGAAARAAEFHHATDGGLPLDAILASAINAGEDAAPAPKTTVVMRNGAYRPAHVRIADGSRVTWFNRSRHPNTAETDGVGYFELDRDKLSRKSRFDIHTMQQGEAESVVFHGPGIYNYVSSLDDGMRGTVEVVER